MEKAYNRTNWQNEPSTATPINQTNLNNAEAGIDTIDNRVVALDSRVGVIEGLEPTMQGYMQRAENAAIESESYAKGGTESRPGEDTDNADYYRGLAAASATAASGSATAASNSAKDSEAYAIGKRNGTDVDIGDAAYHNNSKYYASVASSFATDASDSATVSDSRAEDSEAWAVGTRDGSDVGSSDDTYHNNAKYYAGVASTFATTAIDSAISADGSAEDSEAYAIGTRDGVDVTSGDVAYHNNSKYYAGVASSFATDASDSATGASGYSEDSEAWAVGKRNGTDVGSTDDTYHNNSKYYAGEASTSATAASGSATAAESSAEDSEAWAVGQRGGTDVGSSDPTYHNNAEYYAGEAAASATAASTSESNAHNSQVAAKASEDAAALSETNASDSENNAATSESNASASATAAAGSATSASSSARDSEAYAVGKRGGTDVESSDPTYHNNSKYYSEQAAASATAAASSAASASDINGIAKSWAVGPNGSTSTSGTDTNNAYWWYQQAMAIAQGLAGALLPMGTITFAQLPTSDVDPGYMYNISDEFTTDSRFKEGAGHVIPAGSNVYYTADDMWDVMAGSPVSGVKGEEESTYRTGNVNITRANLGLGTSAVKDTVTTLTQGGTDVPTDGAVYSAVHATKPVSEGGTGATDASTARTNLGLGSAAVLDVASSGDASTTQVVKGDDSRLTDSRNAADVYDWAKASAKPSYGASEISGLGTAAVKDVPSSGDASSSQVVLGDDSRLTDARNAADVYAWAKAATKPTYTASEVGLGNVNNTSDADKPISTATQTALNGKMNAISGTQGQMIGFDSQGNPEAQNVPSSGHTIVDENGTSYTKRTNLKFVNATITDDSTNDTTIIEVEGGGTEIVQKPTVSVGTYTYSGSAQGPTITWPSGTEDKCVVTNATKISAGTYTLTIALKNSSKMVWSDMTTADLTYNYTINKATVALPSVTDTSKTYNGSSQSPTIGSYDSTKLTVSGNSATNAGNYTVVFSLIDSSNYQMSGTNNVAWSIAKANQKISLSSSSVTLDGNHLTATVTVSGNQGSLSVSTSDSTVATASISSSTVTISNVNQKSGSATITVSAAATTNYNSATASISVAANFLVIVTFADGTDAQIKAMLDAYYSGDITWAEMGWAVGNTRTIHLNAMQAPNPNSSNTWEAQDITVVIVAHDHNDLATPINGHLKSCITVQVREVLNNNSSGYNQPGHIYVNGDSSYDMSFTKWANLYMRTYLNNTVLGAFPSGDFKDAIKPSKHYRHTNYNTSDDELVTDTLFLPSYPEIFGTASYSNYVATSPVEGTQFEYYQTASNRIKYGNNDGSSNGVAQYWWEGSPSSYYYSSFGYYWCAVVTDGSAARSYGSYACGLAPAFAM